MVPITSAKGVGLAVPLLYFVEIGGETQEISEERTVSISAGPAGVVLTTVLILVDTCPLH